MYNSGFYGRTLNNLKKAAYHKTVLPQIVFRQKMSPAMYKKFLLSNCGTILLGNVLRAALFYNILIFPFFTLF